MPTPRSAKVNWILFFSKLVQDSRNFLTQSSSILLFTSVNYLLFNASLNAQNPIMNFITLKKMWGWRKMLSFVYLLQLDTAVVEYWCGKPCGSHQPCSWFINVGGITSSSEEAKFWVVLLHSPTIHCFCCLPRHARWRFPFLWSCWRNFSLYTWSVS